MRAMLGVASAAAILVTFGACTSAIKPIENRPLSAPRAVTLKEVGDTIALAVGHRNWTARKVAPGHIEAMYVKARHVVVVDILFDTEKFSIRYKNSENMRHSGNVIHTRYNEWTEKLARLISGRVANMY